MFGKVFILATSQKDGDELTWDLRDDGWRALSLHAKKGKGEKSWVINEFVSGRHPILVSTSFGRSFFESECEGFSRELIIISLGPCTNGYLYEMNKCKTCYMIASTAVGGGRAKEVAEACERARREEEMERSLSQAYAAFETMGISSASMDEDGEGGMRGPTDWIAGKESAMCCRI